MDDGGRQACELRAWMLAHGGDFAPLRVRDAHAQLGRAIDGQPVVELTVVLDSPSDPRAGWPAGRLLELVEAVNREARRSGPVRFVRVLPQPT